MITIKLIRTEEFYPTMSRWAKGRNFPLPPLSFLPTNTAVAFNAENEPVYSISLYHTDSEVLWIGWELSDSDVDLESRKKATPVILKHIEEYAKVNGYKHILTTSDTPPVELALNRAGFIKADTNINQYIKNI